MGNALLQALALGCRRFGVAELLQLFDSEPFICQLPRRSDAWFDCLYSFLHATLDREQCAAVFKLPIWRCHDGQPDQLGHASTAAAAAAAVSADAADRDDIERQQLVSHRLPASEQEDVLTVAKQGHEEFIRGV